MTAFSLEHRLEANPKLRTIYDRVKEIPPIDSAHDFHHTRRVAVLSAEIFEKEKLLRFHSVASADEIDSSIAAALLHDCVPVAKNSPLRKESARLCSEKAQEWLNELSWDRALQPLIVKAILDHSYSSGRIPDSLIGEVLQDADRLEALGALGLYRTIATGVSMGTVLFDPNDPWAKNRDLNDREFTIDHFFTKLFKLPETFRTESAKSEAKNRAQFLRSFLDQLKAEMR